MNSRLRSFLVRSGRAPGPRWVGALVLALLVLASAPALAWRAAPWAEGGPSRPQDLKVSLATFGPGSDVPSWFGHTALAVEDERLKIKRLYNYGMFSFGPDMVPKYLMGRLEFWVAPTAYERTLQMYAGQDRDVRLIELNLPPERRARMARFLEDNIRPENREYLYHHYNDNCATRVRDVIDLAVDGQFEEFAERPARMTLRGHTRRHAIWSILDFGMMYAMNDILDAPIAAWDEMFLPVELEDHVRAFRYTDDAGEQVPLAGEVTVIHEAQARPATPEEPGLLWPFLLLAGLALGGALVGGAAWRLRAPEARGRRVVLGLYVASLGASFGGAGTLLTLMWAFTDHTVVYANENLFWTHPITLLLLPVGLMVAFGSSRAWRWLPRLLIASAAIAALGLVLKVLPWFDQRNWLTIALCAPLWLGGAGAAWLILEDEGAGSA